MPGAAWVVAGRGQSRATAVNPQVAAAAKERAAAHASPTDSTGMARSRVGFDASSNEQAPEKQGRHVGGERGASTGGREGTHLLDGEGP